MEVRRRQLTEYGKVEINERDFAPNADSRRSGGRPVDSDDFGQSFGAEVGHRFRLMSAGHSD
jgi:hypothetical protein